jgi:hypothetical protein
MGHGCLSAGKCFVPARCVRYPSMRGTYSTESWYHAGQENGRLKVTWQDFEKFGVHRSFIKQALGELTAVGLIAIEQPGRRPHGPDRGDPTQYRLTHLPVCEPDNFRPATNEWKRFEEDITAAKSAIKAALPKQPSKPNGKVKHTWKAGTTLQ